MRYPLETFGKHRAENEPELLAAMIADVSKFSKFVDTTVLYAHLVAMFDQFNHRDLELLAIGLSWGLVVAKTGNRADPGNLADMRRILPMPTGKGR